MISDTYSQASSDPPQNHRDQKCFPTEKEQSGQCPNVERNHNESGDPNDGLRKRLVMREDLWYSHIVHPDWFGGKARAGAGSRVILVQQSPASDSGLRIWKHEGDRPLSRMARAA
jgi:hypothetical protein